MQTEIKNIEPPLTIKVCIDPHCSAVFHKCPKKKTRCPNCNMLLVEINQKQYWKKFRTELFQYDALTLEYYRPKSQLSLSLS